MQVYHNGLLSFGMNPLPPSSVINNFNLTSRTLVDPVLAPFVVDTGNPTTVNIRVLYRSEGNNTLSPNIFSLSTFISSKKSIDFTAEVMFLVQWEEHTQSNVS